ncbi:putative prolyl 4-hydroxylase 6 [Diplonema papillatum]|nr:putative prolyl 4-hydroxylase 6 [Diplonema papillatum]
MNSAEKKPAASVSKARVVLGWLVLLVLLNLGFQLRRLDFAAAQRRTTGPPGQPAPGAVWLPDTAPNTTTGVITAEAPRLVTWRVLSAKPRILYLEGFLDPGDAEELIDLAEPKLQRSRVVSSSGGGRVAGARTSEGTFLQNSEAVVQKLRRRVSLASLVPHTHIERTQILRYREGQQYSMHPDYFLGKKKASLGRFGQRIATLIAWLNHVPAGGETRFNKSPPLEVKPVKNDAVLFYNVDAHGVEDPTAVCPLEPASILHSKRRFTNKHGRLVKELLFGCKIFPAGGRGGRGRVAHRKTRVKENNLLKAERATRERTSKSANAS